MAKPWLDLSWPLFRLLPSSWYFRSNLSQESHQALWSSNYYFATAPSCWRKPRESHASNPSSTTPSLMVSILMPSTATFLLLVAIPWNSGPVWVPVRCHLVTTRSPSQIISLTSKFKSGNDAIHCFHWFRNDSRPTPNSGSFPAAFSAIKRSMADSFFSFQISRKKSDAAWRLD